MTEDLGKRSDRGIVGSAIASLRRGRSRLMPDAARRASALVTEEAEAHVQRAERQAEEIRRDAEREAQTTRRDAVESARRVLERIDALERPLAELVMTLREEVDGVLGEIEAPVDVESVALPSANDHGHAEVPADPPTPAPAVPSADGPTKPQGARPEPRSESVPEDLPHTGQGSPGAPLAEPAAKPWSERWGVLSRLRPRSGDGREVFVTTEGNCAVCQTAFMAGDEESLRTSGWRVSGEVGLCHTCQNDGWQLPEGARLPFRPAGSRGTPSE